MELLFGRKDKSINTLIKGGNVKRFSKSIVYALIVIMTVMSIVGCATKTTAVAEAPKEVAAVQEVKEQTASVVEAEQVSQQTPAET